jgi:hypothetical protein
MIVSQTERLNLRHWLPSDREPFARLNADARVMEHFPNVLSREESDQGVDRIESHFQEHGFGLCAAELRETGAFIGFVGLAIPSFEAHFTPCVEIGWRLGAEYWGQGLATEGAREMVRYAFEVVKLKPAGFHDGSCQHAFPARDGKAGHDPRSVRRLRSPESSGRSPAAPPRAVPAAAFPRLTARPEC